MSDYDRIARAIAFIEKEADHQPNLEQVAAHIHLSPYHFQRLFSRWAGVTPKRFLQALTVERAKRLLTDARPVLEVAHELGLSSGSRLYDHFVQVEAITPGEFKRQGTGLEISHALHETPFGQAFVASTPRGICRLAFIEPDELAAEVNLLHRKWPHATIREATDPAPITGLFRPSQAADRPLSLLVSGTNFQINVWRALLRIPPGHFASYGQIANALGSPNASRAVGSAVGANPIAFFIPCHRVICQNGELGGYRWGLPRKRLIQAWEAVHTIPEA